MKKILIIEDDERLIENLDFHLGKNNYKTKLAQNASDGVKFSITENPDLIICDIMLPDFDGYQVLEKIKKNEKTRYIPFIFISAKSGEENIRKGLSLGADDYLSKPFDISELLISIKNNIDRSNPVEYIILIIEDDLNLLDNLEIILNENHFKVILAANGKEGIKLARINQPDLIISDILLPDIDGYEVLKKLKSDDETKSIPFIFLSVVAEEDSISKGLNLGADEYIKKPFNTSFLIDKIKKTIDKKSIFRNAENTDDKILPKDNINYFLDFLNNRYFTKRNIMRKFQKFIFENLTLISVNLKICMADSAMIFQNYLLKVDEIKKNYIIIIDFSNSVYIDSVFIGALVNIVKIRDLKKDEIIVIVDQKKLQSNMFLLANIERLFITFSDVQSALKSII